MAYQLSSKFQRLLNQDTKSLNLILEIEGVPIIYSAQGLSQAVRVGAEGLRIGNDWRIGGTIKPLNNRDVISLKDGTSKRITQQIREDQSASTSIKSINISLVDKDLQVNGDLNTQKFISEILNKRCDVYLGMIGGTSHPEDSVQIFAGNISQVNLEAGLVKLLIQAPETLKRQQIIPQFQGELVTAINATDTTLQLDSVESLIQTQSTFESYIRIDDEIIEVGSIDYANNTLNSCTRGRLNSFAANHDAETSVESLYRIMGKPLELILGLIFSGPKVNPISFSINKIINNQIVFSSYDIIRESGISVGDQIKISGSVVNTGLERITAITIANGESIVEVNNDLGLYPFLADERGEFFSRYRDFNFGGGLDLTQVDVDQFELIETLFGAGFPEVDYFLKEDIDLQEFVDLVLYSIGAISIERKGKISITYTAPPLGDPLTKVLDKNNIVKPEKIKSSRSVNKRFYNTIEYVYDEFSLTDKRQRKNILFSAESFDSIKIGRKVLKIDAAGFRANAGDFIDAQSKRFLDRYKFGAETFEVETTFKFGLPVEVGDVVLWSPKDLRVWDYTTDSFDFVPRKMEVTNKSVDYTTGNCKLSITDTTFGNTIQYSTIGGASYVAATGSTLNEIVFKKLITTPDTEFETYKWANFEGTTLRIRNDDFTYSELFKFVGISPTNPNAIRVSGLTQVPTEDMIVCIPDYQDADDLHKAFHGFVAPRTEVTNVLSPKQFEVSDPSIFFENSRIDIYNLDYSIFENNLTVESVTANTITLKDNLDVTIATGFKVSRIGFVSDKRPAYGYY